MVNVFIRLIAYVIYFLKNLDKNQPHFDQMRNEITRLISESDEFSQKSEISFSHDDYDLARFAVIVWIDEAIMNSSWRHKGDWMKAPLQSFYYNTSNGGEIFFEKLASLSHHQNDAREIYYICLALGFTGKYSQKEDLMLLDQLRESNLKFLTNTSIGRPSLDHEILFPDAYPPESNQPQRENKKSLSFLPLICIGIPPLFYAILFFVYRFVLNNMTGV